MIERISVVIITRNAEQTLPWALDSVRDFPEVIVYDNGSSDGTLDVAKRYSNVKLHTGAFLGFGPTKNYAISLATNDWILSIDADEALDERLRRAISGLNLEDEGVVYRLLRDNYFMGRLVRYGGWGGDRLVRLFNRKRQHFTDAKVHERIDVKAGTRVADIDGRLQHRAVEDIDQFLQKIQLYSGLKRERAKRVYSPIVIVLRAAWAFFRSYILKLGILAGWRGLVIAVSNANGVFYKYMKIYADKKR